tara:strand:+ start:1475 stop:2050 length:576 start_codon:yes stop_codon:yes gene_type:complete
MSEYFTYFPTIEHDLTNVGQKVTLTNVLRRFIVRNDLQERTDIFYKYNVQEGDRPDIIAEKYYGDADLAWLVLHFNDIKDPIFEFPLFGRNFDNYIKGKYGSVLSARAEVHEYRRILQEKEVKFDGTIIPERYVVVDLTTYNTLNPTARRTIYKYDWEEELNEKKREIKILDKRYTDKVRDEIETVLRDGI